jgi:hypothetical protein
MKRALTIWYFLLALPIFIFILLSCENGGGEYTSPFSSTPDALPVYDSSSGGVYKGTLIGSTGYCVVWLKNGNDEIYIELVLDNKKATLTTADLGSWSPGTAISSAEFTGTWNGLAVTAALDIDADGSNPYVAFSIPGHPVDVILIKEVSSALLAQYSGTATSSGDTEPAAEFSILVTYRSGSNSIIGYAEDDWDVYIIDPINFDNYVTFGTLTAQGLTITDLYAVFTGGGYLVEIEFSSCKDDVISGTFTVYAGTTEGDMKSANEVDDGTWKTNRKR